MDTPLREPTFWILTALAGPPLHGYGIIGEVAALSEGRLSMRPGTLYGALDRLVDAGLIKVDREEVVDGRLRRYYRLSGTGNATLAAETERLRRNVEAATNRLGELTPTARPIAPRAVGGLA
ncbi:PadR family transcriptional regulator [Micromonospora sp. U21]|uniref:PadR family transcriptional regulator n=1 Tax=Micromonospora sp. U21 TaxID=2824899 RepID=UPI001B391D78|nr:helix-turn-helix transcriptional regulator [Micromonospora sp. U21]MBQ0903895.1 helix-turn-helix transcriptional regulator [Micromonospora sp. U21]